MGVCYATPLFESAFGDIAITDERNGRGPQPVQSFPTVIFET